MRKIVKKLHENDDTRLLVHSVPEGGADSILLQHFVARCVPAIPEDHLSLC